MVVDTSVLLAVLFGEPDAGSLLEFNAETMAADDPSY